MSVQIENKKWLPFKITDLFEVKGTKTTPLKILKTKDETEQLYPYVTTKSDFMGVDGFFKFFTEEGNVIVFDSATDGNIHYQETRFSASDHVEKLVPKFDMNKYVGFFMVASIRYALKNKFSYGYKLSQTRIKRQILMLPVNDNEEPDFRYMEDYVKNTYAIEIQNFSKNIIEKLDAYEYKDIPSLNEVCWDSFFIESIGDVKSGKDITKKSMVSGDTPYISATALNNGVSAFVGNENTTLEKYCISINRNGSVGYAFYHPYNALFSNDCRKLITGLDKYCSLFIVNQIKAQKDKYNYGYKMGTNRIKRQKILLPINDEGEPDYNYMRQYLINTEISMLKKYLSYINDKI